MEDENTKNIRDQGASNDQGIPRPAVATPALTEPQDRMSTLLGSIKLPGRESFRGSADKKITPIISVMPHQLQKPISDPLPKIIEEKLESPTPETDSVVAPLRTFKHDIQDVVAHQKISLVHAVALEEQKKMGQERLTTQFAARSQRIRRTTVIVFGIVVLIGLGSAALFGVLTIAGQRSGNAGTSAQDSSLLFAEQTVVFPIDETSTGNAKQALAALRTSSAGSLGSIVRVVPVVTIPADAIGPAAQRPATTREFFQALGTHPSDELIRALSNQFFFGIHTVDKNAPVLIIPVTSYDHAFAGMLAWESVMNSDLQPVFTPVPILTTGSSGIPTQRIFIDEVMHNYDTRALKDDNGSVELYYTFPTRNILIIAESPYSLTEVLSRLQAARRM